MIASIAFVLLGTAVAATPCENLTTLKLTDATITSATVVPEGPAPAAPQPLPAPGAAAGGRGGGGQAGRGQANNAVPAVPGGNAAPQAGARGAGGQGGRGGGGQAGAGAPAARPNIPAHCRVVMVLKPTTDSIINMEIWLPTQNWNGKFMGVGNGGFAGSIQGIGSEMPAALRLGYATAGTDTGHQNSGGEWAIGHPEKMIDFGYRATHEMTLKGKQIVKTFYDQSPKYSYFKGCSTGGRMAMMEAQRYPDDYDGIIAGSLASRHIHMWTSGFARGIELTRHPEGAVTAEQATLVNTLIMGKCDTLKEGFLNNPKQCKVDFAALKCPAGKSDNSCLTEPQIKTVETYFGGLKNSKGELIFSGQALGNAIGAQRGAAPGNGGTFDLMRIAYNDPNVDWHNFDLDKDMKYLDEKIGYVDAVDPNLSKFKKSGGKLILTHGWADTGITPETTVWYYESVLDKMGKKQDDWMRLFMAPGMGHCGGGPGVNTFDSISALEQWVEKGVAPATMMGKNNAGTLTRPLCPYPQYAEYKGSGDLKDAANWACTAPAEEKKKK